MFYEVTLNCVLGITEEDLGTDGLVSQRFIVTRLLKGLSCMKGNKDLGYFLCVTSLKHIGKGERVESPRCIRFPVAVSCRTFIPCAGEIMQGAVWRVQRQGVFLSRGPMKYIYLSIRKMADYQRYVPGKNPAYLNDSLSRIEIDVVVRFVVFGVRWCDVTREFMVLASLEGDSLGPVSLAGSGESDM